MSQPTPLSTQSETMSQSEVERLLAAVGEEEPSASAGAALKEIKQEQDSLERHEFPRVSSFSAAQLRTLRVRHEDYIRGLASRLSGHLRLECSLQMAKLETARFRPFMEGLSNPTDLVLFRLDPIDSICFLEIPPRLGLSMIDRELGGPGICADEGRDLTKMEMRLLSRIIDITTTEWCSYWSDVIECRPVILRHETCGRFVQTHPPELMLLVLGLEIRMGDLTEQMQLAFPHSALAPLVRKIDEQLGNGTRAESTQAALAPRWNNAYSDMQMRVSAEWFGLELTARELGGLKAGDILRLSPGSSERIQISVDENPKFQGQLGTCGQHWAVKIARQLAPTR